MSAYEELLEFTENLAIVDTHQHLPSSEESWLDGSWRGPANLAGWDIVKEYLGQSFRYDLLSAGLAQTILHRILEEEMPVLDRWNLLDEYWQYARYTGFGRVCDAAARGLYGLPGFRRDTIQDLNDAFLQSLQPGKYHRVLVDLANISIGLNESVSFRDDDTLDCDPVYFRPVFNIDHLIRPGSIADILRIERRTGTRITSFERYLHSCEASLDWAVSRGAIALKSTMAYYRSLRFDRTTKDAAETRFNELLSGSLRDVQDHHPKLNLVGYEAQDYLMHHVLDRANERGMVLQVHTGYQDGAGSYLAWSDPTLLTNQFIQYPDLRFVIFHIGYPFHQKLSALAKHFTNVYIDMCWAHAISPDASVRALVEWLEVVPYNKICGFGSDDVILDAVYGNRVLALENISRALAVKVDLGRFGVERAKQIAECLLRENAGRIYRLFESPNSPSAVLGPISTSVLRTAC